jgi:hypothetical protein
VAAQTGVGRLALGGGEQVADVGGVEAARHERFLGDRLAAVGEPLVEVLGPAVDRPHPHRGDVQQMERIGGRVGDAGAEGTGAVDQVDLQGAVFSVLAQEVDGGKRPGGAAADDRDALGRRAHRVARAASGTGVPSWPPLKASSAVHVESVEGIGSGICVGCPFDCPGRVGFRDSPEISRLS